MHVLKTTLDGNPNIGLYGIVTNNICLLGSEVPDKTAEEIQKTLDVPVHKITIAGTSLIGAFLVSNSKKLLIPSLIFDHELEKIKQLGLNYSVINTELTALGNNIIINDHACFINPEFSKSTRKELSQALQIEPKEMEIGSSLTVGSCIAFNSAGGVVHKDIDQETVRKLESELKLELQLGSINGGNPLIRSGVIANDNGFIVGEHSTGPEVQNLDEGLGFIKY